MWKQRLGMMLTIVLGVGSAWVIRSPLAKANFPFCVDCQLMAQTQAMAQASPINAPAMNNEQNIAALMQGVQPILPFETLHNQMRKQMAAQAAGIPMWDGVGRLPGSFEIPWRLPKTDFSPVFVHDCGFSVGVGLRCNPVPELDRQNGIIMNDDSEGRVRSLVRSIR